MVCTNAILLLGIVWYFYVSNLGVSVAPCRGECSSPTEPIKLVAHLCAVAESRVRIPALCKYWKAVSAAAGTVPASSAAV